MHRILPGDAHPTATCEQGVGAPLPNSIMDPGGQHPRRGAGEHTPLYHPSAEPGPYSGYAPGRSSRGDTGSDAPPGVAAPEPPSSSTSGANASSKPIRRRMRLITSCLECRRRKLKCDKSHPCTNCVKFDRECHYFGPKLDQASQVRLTEMKEKVGSLERQLERDVARSGKSQPSGPKRSGGILADDVEDEFAEERDLEPTELTELDVTYEDDADGTDDIIDLGVQVGRMRITDRIGGLSRPRLSEEVSCLEEDSAALQPWIKLTIIRYRLVFPVAEQSPRPGEYRQALARGMVSDAESEVPCRVSLARNAVCRQGCLLACPRCQH